MAEENIPIEDNEQESTLETDIEYRYTNRSEEQLKQIAMDLYHGHIFTDRMLEPHHGPIFMTFLPLIAMPNTRYREAYYKDLGLLFEYYSVRGPMSHNGVPTFFSVRRLDVNDYEKMVQYLDEYKIYQDKIKSDWTNIDTSHDQTY